MNYYDEIKNELISNDAYKRVKDYSKNRSDLSTYYNVGKLLSEAGKHYGEGIIREYSNRLSSEIGKTYNDRTLRNMRQFYKTIIRLKWPTLSAKMTYSHYLELIQYKSINKIQYYINICENSTITVRELRRRIQSGEYERLPKETRDKLISNNDVTISDFVKNPIIIKNSLNKEAVSEKILQKIILEDIEQFMRELGTAFSFIGSEYKIKIGDIYNYIDIMLFNYDYNCFVVVELKVTELKKEHIGQIQVYMNYVDNNLKRYDQNKTIGIIICKKDNKYVIEYSSDPRIISREYKLV